MIEQADRERKNIQYKYILIGLLILLGLIIFRFTRPYMSGFLGAATLYVIFNGQLSILTNKYNIRQSFSVLLIVLVLLFFILIPLSGIAFFVIDTFSGITIDPQAILEDITAFILAMEERLGFGRFTPGNLSG